MGVTEVNFDVDVSLAPRASISFCSFFPTKKVQNFYLELEGHRFASYKTVWHQLHQSDYMYISKHGLKFST